MATLRQLLANRRNAQHSTGPRTPEGRALSRRNALVHGLSAAILLPDEEAEAAAERALQWNSSLRPWNAFELWLAEQVARLTLLVERCQQHDAVLADLACRRALDCWDEDRAAAAAVLASALPDRPAEVARRLRQTRHGCAWLLERWQSLARALDAQGAWDAPQHRLALDLLGVPLEFRAGPTPLELSPRALVSEQIAQLTSLAGPLEELDALEREAAEAGLGPDLDRPRALLRRYERSLTRRLEWCLSQFKKHRPDLPGPPPSLVSPIPPQPPSPDPQPLPPPAPSPTIPSTEPTPAPPPSSTHPSPHSPGSPEVPDPATGPVSSRRNEPDGNLGRPSPQLESRGGPSYDDDGPRGTIAPQSKAGDRPEGGTGRPRSVRSSRPASRPRPPRGERSC